MHQPDEREGMSGEYFSLDQIPEEYREACALVNAHTAKTIELSELLFEAAAQFMATGEGATRVAQLAYEVERNSREAIRMFDSVKARMLKELSDRDASQG